ncbi:MAG: HAMP domain-containing protein [Ardenticatenaceae bacterium]|nr:HAMP domain-containing protein [Ardenticatenaceae bacterium]
MAKWKRPFLRRKPKIQLLNATTPPPRRSWPRRALARLNPFQRRKRAKRPRRRRLRHAWQRLLAFFKRINPLRSLWFRLMGAFIVVILIMLFSVLSAINEVTAREFNRYVSARDEAIRARVATLIPEMPEAPDMPQIEVVVTAVPSPPFAEYSDTMPESSFVVVDSVTLEPIIEGLLTDLGSDPDLLFLDDVRAGARVAVFIAGMVAIFLGTLIFRQITRPLKNIRLASQSLAAGDLSARVPLVKSHDELGRVADAFNQMAEQLQQQERLRQQMVADVAHELRTPITVMQSNLEAMLDGLLQPEESELRELHDEARRLARMIEDLRLLSLADTGRLSLREEPVNVAEVVDAVVARLTPLAQRHVVTLEADVKHLKLAVLGDADRLQQALGNLIDNAIRHTPQGGRVRVTAVREANTIHVSVADTGSGIPASDLPYIFERFWRGDKSRSRHSGGSGLGLAIVQQIVTLHGGTVRVASPPGAGAIFTISLPMQKTVVGGQ